MTKKQLYDAYFEKGTCIAFQLQNGHQGAAFMLEAEKQTELGLNLVAICDYNAPSVPGLDFFESAHLLLHTAKAQVLWVDRESIAEIDYRIIGRLDALRDYKLDDFRAFGSWASLPNLVIRSDPWIQERVELRPFRTIS